MNKADLELLGNEYQEAKMEEFQIQLMDELSGMETNEADIDFFQGFIGSFDFPDKKQWFTERNFK